MVELFLLRHAQAESSGPRGDVSRPLSDQGRRDAQAVGRRLRDAGVQLALVSSATRTRETFEALGLDCRAEYMDVLYQAGVDEVLQRVHEVDDDVQRLLVVGHSPAIPTLAAMLAHAADPGAADDLQCHYPTATVARFAIDGTWPDVGERPARLLDVDRR